MASTMVALTTPIRGTPINQKKNRIQVSNTKKPLFFYVNLAKRYIQQHNEVELSALGMAITTVVTIAEILKNNGFALEKKVCTSTIGMKDENKGRVVQKAKIEIVLEKTEKFDSLMSHTPTSNNHNKRDDNNKNTHITKEDELSETKEDEKQSH
ncbi:hypothetical protein RND81_04G029200 [Saponaria officinalis]|uniref:DNA/RNA-binding protein Alba-like domain-containing protein n=1 Tax=Saponaria officinalis TaxID=3572 RepID=A0AAW1LJX3_SAPOF